MASELFNYVSMRCFSAVISSDPIRCQLLENILIVDGNKVVNDDDDPKEADPMADQADANANEEVGVELEEGEQIAIIHLIYSKRVALD